MLLHAVPDVHDLVDDRGLRHLQGQDVRVRIHPTGHLDGRTDRHRDVGRAEAQRENRLLLLGGQQVLLQHSRGGDVLRRNPGHAFEDGEGMADDDRSVLRVDRDHRLSKAVFQRLVPANQLELV